ncbi:MAG TPA: hypothetical protein VGL46_05005 [Pseudonocardiaceae bacterium]
MQRGQGADGVRYRVGEVQAVQIVARRREEGRQMSRYALVGAISGELASYGGRVLVHDSQAELEYLIPGGRVVTLPSHIPPEQTLPIAQHPEMAAVRFPLQRGDFR